MIRFHCPECGELEECGRGDRGKAFSCSRCGKRLVAPPRSGKALLGIEPPPVVVLKVASPLPSNLSRRPGLANEAPGIAVLAVLALILCWMMAGIKLYKHDALPHDARLAYEQSSFPQRMGLEPMTPPTKTFDKCVLLNQGLAVGMAVALVLVAVAAPGVGAKRPGLGLGLLVFAVPLPLLALQ